MISNCGKGESGYSGQQAGDQTGKEYWLISWFNCSWNCVLRHPNAKVRSLIAELATEAAKNDNIGYDQSDRLTFWNALRSAGYHPGNITIKCEADCSSSTAAIIKAAGFLSGNAMLQNVSESLTTYNMRQALLSAGFQCYTESKYINSDSYLIAGDIILNDSQHVAIQVTDGTYGQMYNTTTESTDTYTPDATSTDVEKSELIVPLMLGSIDIGSAHAVKDMQDMLIKLGYDCGPDGADGDFGVNTRLAVINFQSQKGLQADGIYGPATKKALESAFSSMFGDEVKSDSAVTTEPAAPKDIKPDEWVPKVGDVVNFTGKIQYIMPQTDVNIPAYHGHAKVTMILDNAKHKYHIVGIRGDAESAHIMGWVNLDMIEKV